MSDLGERFAGLEARFEEFSKYTHQRWHDLSNDLQPLMRLPEQMARDMGKMDGRMSSEVRGVEKTIEKVVTESIEKAMNTIHTELAKMQGQIDEHDGDIKELKKDHHGRGAANKLLHIGTQIIISLITAAVAVLALMRK